VVEFGGEVGAVHGDYSSSLVAAGKRPSQLAESNPRQR
jgi:hypothetical protein